MLISIPTRQPALSVHGMHRAGVLALVVVLALSAVLVPHASVLPGTAAPEALDWDTLPLAFIPNVGQSDSSVRFQTQSVGGTLFFTQREVVLTLPHDVAPPTRHAATGDMRERKQQMVLPSASVVRLAFDDANPTPVLTSAAALPGHVNYVQRNDPTAWHTDIPTYAGIVYQDLYAGIDLHYDGADGQLKGTYTVAPGSDPQQIRWHYMGVERVHHDPATGDLQIRVPHGQTLTEQAPIAWQVVNGTQVPVAVRYQVAADQRIGFAVGQYDPTFPLVIDPTLQWSTFLGGSDADEGRGIAVDGAGNVYVTGTTFSADFPTQAARDGTLDGVLDAFVTKLRADGRTVVYSTFLGGSSRDRGFDLAVDAAGNVYVTGDTISPDFPLKQPIDAVIEFNDKCEGLCAEPFLTKLSPAGTTVVYSTLLGGDDIDESYGIAVDLQGFAYLTGFTASTNFPTRQAFDPVLDADGTLRAGDAFVAKIDPTGYTLVYATYLGGSGGDDAQDIAADATGNAYLIGQTDSDDFPTHRPLQPTRHGDLDAFVTKLSADGGALLYSTYLGGMTREFGNGIAVDQAGQAHLVGTTFSTDFPTTNALQPGIGGGECGEPEFPLVCPDVYVAKLNRSGTALLYSTYLGGNDEDVGIGLDLDRHSTVYLTGQTFSANFPTKHAPQPTSGGFFDAFVTTLRPDGQALRSSTYLGGTGLEVGLAIAADGQGGAYVTGQTSSVDFPTVDPLQPVYGGAGDAFVVRLRDHTWRRQVYLPLTGR